MPIHPVIIFSISFTMAVLLTPLMQRFALKKGWVAQPKEDRWHKKPTALMGGIAIFASISIPLVAIAEFWPLVFYNNFIQSISFRDTLSVSETILIGGSILFFLGLYDDLHNIKPHNKFIAQILVASFVVFLGYRLNWFESLTLDAMATLFWIVGITNAFNLIDNMDGLCAGVGLVASVGMAILYQPIDQESFSIAMILAGAMAGFLIFNFNPAKIFMGDCGSLVIGFCVSVLTLSFSKIQAEPFLSRVAVPVLILLVPILDTTLVTFIRLLSGRKASTGGRDHTSHRLVLIGFSEKSAVLFLYGVGAISGFAAIFVSRNDTITSPAVIIPVIISIVLMGVYLSQLRVYPEKEFSVLRNRSFTPILMELTYKRQILLVLFDLILVVFSYYLAYRLRFEGDAFLYYFNVFQRSLPAVIACKMLVFYCMGIYRGFWKHISANDAALYVRASIFGSLLSVVALTFIYRFQDFSKGIFIIDWMLTTGLLIGTRGAFRLFMEIHKKKTLSGDKVIIYGAGRAGELLLREILNNKSLSVNPVGFVDDDALKKGKKIQGYPIFGGFHELNKVHAQHKFNGILVSFNHTNGTNMEAHRAAKNYCRARGLFLKHFRINLQEVALDSKSAAGERDLAGRD